MRSFKYIIYIGITLAFGSLLSCGGSKKLSTKVIGAVSDLTGNAEDDIVDPSWREIAYEQCNDPLAYAPYLEDREFFQVRWIRLNFHFMDRSEKDQNFEEDSEEAKKFVEGLVENANYRLNQNFKMELPAGNETPQLQPQYQYVVVGSEDDDDGLYWHYDDELYFFLNKGRNKTNYKREVIKKYNVDGENVLNVFLIPHHPDSVASKTYRQTTAGIALGTDIKIGSEWNKPDKNYNYATMLNHEIGHVMTLRHSWIKSDGCDDTPSHKNCYGPTEEGRCKGPTSNNMMDYNHSQMSITPCQIGKVHRIIANLKSVQRKLIVDDYCDYNPNEVHYIKRNIEWMGAKDLNRDIIIKDGGSLSLHCRLSMAAGAKIYVEPGGVLNLNECIIHNSCGDEWGGIHVESKGKKQGIVNYTGKVILENISNS